MRDAAPEDPAQQEACDYATWQVYEHQAVRTIKEDGEYSQIGMEEELLRKKIPSIERKEHRTQRVA